MSSKIILISEIPYQQYNRDGNYCVFLALINMLFPLLTDF